MAFPLGRHGVHRQALQAAGRNNTGTPTVTGQVALPHCREYTHGQAWSFLPPNLDVPVPTHSLRLFTVTPVAPSREDLLCNV